MPSRSLLLIAAVGYLAVGAARADCESDLLQLEADNRTLDLSPAAKAALDIAKDKSVSPMRKDEDIDCQKAIADELRKPASRSNTPNRQIRVVENRLLIRTFDMERILNPTSLFAVAITLSLPSFPSICVAAFAVASHDSIEAALSTLGNFSAFRSIAQDTLFLVYNGDIAAARTLIKELETAWEKAEPSPKPKDGKASIALDTMIDDALTKPRMSSPKTADCADSLEALIANMDAVGKA